MIAALVVLGILFGFGYGAVRQSQARAAERRFAWAVDAALASALMVPHQQPAAGRPRAT
jgi:hypothetical protein